MDEPGHAYRTQGEINAAFARGELTAEQAADATMQPRPSFFSDAMHWLLMLALLGLIAYWLFESHRGVR